MNWKRTLGIGCLTAILATGVVFHAHKGVHGQSVQNGQQIIPCSSTITLDPNYLAGYLDLNCAVTSVQIAPGSGGKAYHFTVLQDGGSVSGITSLMSGDTSLNATGYTSYRMVWDVPTNSWRTTKIGLLIPTKISQLTNDLGLTSGTNGTNGTNGLSAYQVWLAAGNTGTQAQFLASLVGAAGSAGSTGPQGLAGVAGTAATVTVGTVTALACGATPTVTNTGTTAAAVLAFGIPSCAPLTGTTGSIGGSALLLGACATGTVSVSGAVVGRTAKANPSDGSFIGGNYTLTANVATAGVVTVNICAVAAGTPPAKTYKVSVDPL